MLNDNEILNFVSNGLFFEVHIFYFEILRNRKNAVIF